MVTDTDEDPGLRIESFAIIIKIRNVSTNYKLYCLSPYTLCIMQNKSHQNEAGRSHRPVAVYLMKLQEYRFEKKFILNIFNDYVHLKKSTKLQKNKLKRQILIYWPCFDATRFQVPSANDALCIACTHMHVNVQRIY